MTVEPLHRSARDADLLPPPELLDAAWLFDDPAAYRAGVVDAIEWVRRTQSASPAAETPDRREAP